MIYMGDGSLHIYMCAFRWLRQNEIWLNFVRGSFFFFQTLVETTHSCFLLFFIFCLSLNSFLLVI